VTGALTWARVSYRQQRWELLLVAIGVAGAAAAMLWFASTLDGMRAASPECLGGVTGDPRVSVGATTACQATLESYSRAQEWASNLVNLAWAAPFGIGVILGAPLVAREIDGGTTQLAWSLSRSRVGWLLRRIGFVALFGLLMLGILAITSEVLTAALLPDRVLGEDFAYFGRRGLPVVARGAGAIMLGVLVGSIIGRVLPAILASALIIALVFAGLSLAQDRWNQGEASMERFYDASGNPVAFDLAALDVSYGLETVDGEFLSYGEAFERGMATTIVDERGRVYDSDASYEAGQPVGYDVRLAIPGERYPELMLRDSAIGVILGLAALAVTAAVVTRRRPA
jgi:hypothetical protein